VLPSNEVMVLIINEIVCLLFSMFGDGRLPGVGQCPCEGVRVAFGKKAEIKDIRSTKTGQYKINKHTL
jgi:hypothetical protein